MFFSNLRNIFIGYEHFRKYVAIRLGVSLPGWNVRHFGDDIFKCICLNENISILVKMSLKFVPKGSNNNILSLVQLMTTRRPAIIWTNVEPAHRRIYAALGVAGLTNTCK